MAIYTNTSGSTRLKSYFETGDVPSAANFIDLVDSLAVYDGTLPLISGSYISTGSFALVHVRKLAATGSNDPGGVGYLGGNIIEVGGDLIPDTDATYNLGSASLAWNNVHATTASIGKISSSLLPGKDDTFDLGSSIHEWKDLYVDGTANLDIVNVVGALTVGVDDTGHDVKFFGATSGQYLLWDESADELVLTGDSKLSFHDAAGGENIIASANGHLEINAGTTLDITAPLVDINGQITASGNISASGDLYVTGTATIGTLSVSSLANSVSITGISSSNQILNVSGNIVPHATNTFNLGSTTLLWNNIYATSVSSSLVSSSINKADTVLTTTIGAADNETTNAYINTSTVSQINASGSVTDQITVSGSLVPGANTTLHNLGTASKAWNDLYVGGVGYINHLSSSNDSSFISASVSIIPGADNKYDLGSATHEWNNLHVEGTASIGILTNLDHNVISSSASLVPNNDDAFDLGSSDKEWKDLYIDGTANIDNLSADTASIGRTGTSLVPISNNVYSLGSSDFQWRDLYVKGTVHAAAFASSSGDQLITGYVSASELRINGDITASGHISSSGNILNTGYISSTNITASGTISASGAITGNSLTVDTFSPTHITASGNYSGSGGILATGDLTITGKSHFTGHITASGNISSSGTIYADNFSSANGDSAGISFTDDVVITGHMTSSGTISGSSGITAASATVSTLTVNGQSQFNGAAAAMSFSNPTTISQTTTMPAGYKGVLWVDNANPSITISSGVDYTVGAGGNLSMINLDNFLLNMI